jgi:hypothetical protein
MNIETIIDILAAGFLMLLILYFYCKKNRTNIENILFVLSIAGLVIDIIFG